RAQGRDGCVLTEPRTHDAGNKRPNKSRQCSAHVAKRTERHDSAVEGEHERDQWRRDEIRAEFAGHLPYPAICQRLCSCQPQLRVRAAADTNRGAPPRIAPSAGDCCTAGFRVGLCPLWVISRHYLPPSRCPLYPPKADIATLPRYVRPKADIRAE